MDLRSARSHLLTATTSTTSAGSPARRHFLRSTTALGLGSQIPLPGAAQAAGTSLEAYASATSVAAGGTLTDMFFASFRAVLPTGNFPIATLRFVADGAGSSAC